MVDTGEIVVELSNPEKMKFVYKILLIAHTVEPLYNGHPWDPKFCL